MKGRAVPHSTYRLQFNPRFTFADARDVVDYLHALGISDCYASSYLAAVPGSTHGYDVADPTRLNPDLGTEGDYWSWIEAMRGLGMGHVLDLVPNHMGIARSANPWWQDVLENGPSSRYAHFFDIEWHPVKDELANKVLLPILGDQYGAVLERQELKLTYNEGAFEVRYFDNVLPIAPDTIATILGADLDPWIAAHAEGLGRSVADELQSILTAARHLPPRHSRDPGDIATRAREKEVVKRRLAALAAGSTEVRALVAAAVARMNGIPGVPPSFDRLDRLLNDQSYRLAHWRVASEEINYRRFFDVNQLAALRMEDPSVFEDVHRFVFELVRRGAPTGLRIDHVDGLYAPGDYLRRLQARVREGRPGATEPFYIVVEKILGADEPLPPDWPVCGTTGYEFAAAVNGLFVDRRNERALDDIYARFAGECRERRPFAQLAYASKKRVMHETISGDIHSLGHQLNRFSERNRHFRDFTLYSLISTLKEVIASFPVYRTYVGDGPISDHDRRYITDAVRSARRRAPGINAFVFDFIERLLLKALPAATPEEHDERERFTGKLQQITAPVAAKGIEDTAFYVYNRLLSLNEVGGDPVRFGLEPAVLHEWLGCRQRRWPHALSATSTHDAKRGEDVRARLNVLSEIPGPWKVAVRKWRGLNRRFKSVVNGAPAPSANEEYFLYQTLVGAWPFEMEGEEGLAEFRGRMAAYMVKALREAKVHTSWLSPIEVYEHAVLRFLDGILDPRRGNPFLRAFLPFEARVADLGIYNSLAQLLIKITAPGVPDFYQGTELWELSLVDPDNRRAVDYERRRQMLASLDQPREGRNASLAAELLERRTDGRVKLFTTRRSLAARARLADLFERGEYIALRTSGARRESVFAFARRLGADLTITCVPRLLAGVVSEGSVPIGRAVWSDTRIELPFLAGTFHDVFTGAGIGSEETGGIPSLPVARLFDAFPVALLVADR